MGDRTNPIKFGPEWLRNLSSEPPSIPGATVAPQGVGRDGQGSGARGATPPGIGFPSSGNRPAATTPNPNTSKVLLAKLRYGREEMLALYDRQTVEAPPQLKAIESLYQQRPKPPIALNTAFEDLDPRDTMTRPTLTGGLFPNDRYATSRSRSVSGSLSDNRGENRGRGLTNDLRGRMRGGYSRQTSARGWHGNVRNQYGGPLEDDPNQQPRPWNNNSNQSAPGLRPINQEQSDWQQQKMPQYRNKRPPNNSNWRQQHSREDGEEWRTPDGGRRPQEKWDWTSHQHDPTGRPILDKQQWQNSQESTGRPNLDQPSSANQWHRRRNWPTGENGEEKLPEWALEISEASGGTFDSSGAFHGYSNDDSNLPRPQETSYPLTRSHTHGSFARSNTVEEGSEEWWASEKAKKLSPKRFDDIHFKKPPAPGTDEETSNGQCTQSTGAIPKHNYNTAAGDRASNQSSKKSGIKNTTADNSENKTVEVAMDEASQRQQMEETSIEQTTFAPRSDDNGPNEETGSFQSVILSPNKNNSLRQKHQNIVATPKDPPKRQPGIMKYYHNTIEKPAEKEAQNQNATDSSKIVEDILKMSLDDGIPSATMNQLLTNHSSSAINSLPRLPNPSMQMRMPVGQGVQSGMMQQPIGMTNSMLNASLGLPMPNSGSGLPLQGMLPLPNTGLNQNTLASNLQGIAGGNMPTPGMQMGGIQAAGLQSGQVGGLQMHGNMQNNMQAGVMPNNGMQAGLPGFQSASGGMPGMGNNSLFNMQLGNDLTNHGGQLESLQRLQHMASQSFNNIMYGNMLSQPPPPLPTLGIPLTISADQWYYEDPNKTIQGPFNSQEMYYWYRAGFFSPTLLVRRDCEAVMRPLGTYGLMPFGQMELIHPYPGMAGYDMRTQATHDNMMNSQPGLGMDVPTSIGQPSYYPSSNMLYNPINPSQLQTKVAVKAVGRHQLPPPPLPLPLPMPPFQQVQNNKMESLWGQPANNAATPDAMWLQAINNHAMNESHINTLPIYFWENQASDLPPTAIQPEDMQTEEEIIAHMRASQSQQAASPLSFLDEAEIAPTKANLLAGKSIHQLTYHDEQKAAAGAVLEKVNITDDEMQKLGKTTKAVQNTSDVASAKPQKVAETKPAKEAAKVDNKALKTKDIVTKPKSKNKTKDEKKDEATENKAKEEEVKAEIQSARPSPSLKNKKEEKNKVKLGDLDKEKKEWLKDGFTIVKGADKNKDAKKKAEEAKAVEEVERKRKEEKLAADRKLANELIKKHQEPQPTVPQRQAAESVSKKAPWSASNQNLESNTLAEIQRLEREKKLEQMKEQQQLMQTIALQQATNVAREQEKQAAQGWATKKKVITSLSQTLDEIQAEARKQAMAEAMSMAIASAAAREEANASPVPANIVPWGGNAQNGDSHFNNDSPDVGFWDTPLTEIVKPAPKPVEIPKIPEPKPKKKVTVMAPPKPENTPSVEFDMWCTNMLTAWRDANIDIPTFVSFLREIESPYEVRDYVRCYLADSREASEFARQFLERRSRLFRSGTVEPSDDLCSPAVAVNPRTNSGSDYTEVKGKTKKAKKNKMLKVDARNILGFSVTASEDRINVGDIDSV